MDLYLAHGKLTVKAKGYWFTAGGAKGSFGYYPHLKDDEGFPIYPDTQIRGDLLMAVKVLRNILKQPTDPAIDDFWNIQGKEEAFAFFVSDLELTGESKKHWSHDSYCIRSQIEINDDTRTVESNMLVNRELAYLEGCDLEADIYLGYLSDVTLLSRVKDMLSDAVHLINAFGAQRSRSYGGDIEIVWDENNIVHPDSQAKKENAMVFRFILSSLTNVRNRPLISEKDQTVSSMKTLTSDQVRGWFVRTFHRLYDAWPSAEEMSSIIFHSLYPCLKDQEGISLAYLLPQTIKRTKTGALKDTMDEASDAERNESSNSENFSRTKQDKVQGFVTDGEKPVQFVLETKKRMRNSMNDNFTTKEDGLYAQEYLLRGAIFGGVVRFTNPADDFYQKVIFILNNVRPAIKGCLFQKVKLSAVPQLQKKESKYLGLVIDPIPYSTQLSDGEHPDKEFILLQTLRRYNTMNKRPRRNRIVVAPGSIMYGNHSNLLPWSGFGKDISTVLKKEKQTTKSDAKLPVQNQQDGLNRSQIGQLRVLLNPGSSKEFILQFVEDRLEKYKKYDDKDVNKRLIPPKVLMDVREKITHEGIEKARNYIKDFLEEQSLSRWEKNKSKSSEPLKN
jgi:hypothetical protein